MGGVLPALMKYDNIRNGKAVSFKIFRVVDIKPGKNIVKGRSRRKGRGIDKLIVRPVNGKPRRLQAVVWLKADKERGKVAKPEKKPSIRAQLKADKERAAQKKPAKQKSQGLERS